MTKKVYQAGNIICATCQKPAIILLKSQGEAKYFREYKKGLNCGPCAVKFWESKIVREEIDLATKSPEFQKDYQELKKQHE